MKDIKLGMKMGIGFGILIAIALFLGGLAIWNMNGVGKDANSLAKSYLPEVNLSIDAERNVLDAIINLRLYGATEDPSFLEKGRKSLAGAKQAFKSSRELAGKYPFLVKLKEGLDLIDPKIAEWEAILTETEGKFKTISDLRSRIDDSAEAYFRSCTVFQAAQKKLLNDELSSGAPLEKVLERLSKVTSIDEIIDSGNAVRYSVLKGLAQRDNKLVQEALKEFEPLHAKLAELTGTVRREENKKQLAAIKVAAGEYQGAVSSLIAELQIIQQMNAKRLALANEALEIVRATASTGIKQTDEIAAVAVERLSFSSRTMIVGLIIAVALGILIAIYLTRSITGPLSRGVDLAKHMSDGDFTRKLDINRKDEIGVLAEALNTMASHLGAMFRDISTGVETLSSSSTELFTISQQMSSSARETSDRSNTVATAAEEMSSNMNSVAAATEQASTNVATVASATEEMTATITEIARNSEKARAISAEAVLQGKTASERVDELGRAAREIGKITETITEISEQTNLLALNATIEAARAGEAGKGFAVVANEIKELAKQTASATEEIKHRIGGIQESTGSTVKEISHISEVIHDVSEIVSTIAAAVEEQSVTTREIAANIAQASQGVQEVTGNVAQSSAVAGEIAHDIAGVNQTSNEMTDMSTQVSMSAEELSRLSEQLKEIVSKFKV
jgi:methyl-accepting chemotaxis protein